MALAVYIAFDFVLTRNKDRREKVYVISDDGSMVEIGPKISDSLNLCQKSMVIGAAMFYGIGIGIARIVERVDTVNQVLFGWVLGIWLAIFFASICRDPIFEHVKGIVSCTDEGSKRNTFI